MRRAPREHKPLRAPYSLGAMPSARAYTQLDVGEANAPMALVFDVVRDVERWPVHLPHYRGVKFIERSSDGGGVVEMSANRPFHSANWPTFWRSEMSVDPDRSIVRFRHTGGVTTGMDVEWRFEHLAGGDRTKLILTHVWDGPAWPIIGGFAAKHVILPVFVHGIASLTLAGLAHTAALRMGRT